MNFKTYITWALLSPVLMAAIFWLWPADGPFLILPFTMAFAGLPYCLFCIAFILWAKSREESTVMKISWALPILFSPLAAISSLITQGESVFSVGALGIIGALMAYTIIIGYFYVVVCWVVFWALTKISIGAKCST